MSKKDQYIQDLNVIFERFIEDQDPQELTDFLLSNSNLPGRRANLELAGAFGEVVEHYTARDKGGLWQLCLSFSQITAEVAPVGVPQEFIPFCGAIGTGALGSRAPAFYEASLKELRRLANDPRWRMREAVCFGLQRLLTKRCGDTLGKLDEWAAGGSLLEMRAAAAAVAEPTLLADYGTALDALHIHQLIFDRMPGIQDRKSEDFRILRKALGYTVSVVVSALPDEGFAFMHRLIDSQDADVFWIVKQNLKKKRLFGSFPQEVSEIERKLNERRAFFG